MPLKNKLILAAIGLAVIGMLFVFSRGSSGSNERDTCQEMGIDPAKQVEGTCYVGDTKSVVVDRHHLLRIESLEARIERIDVSKSLSGPRGTKLADGRFVTFDLAITNRTGDPQELEAKQIYLALRTSYWPDVEAESDYEPHSFEAQKTTIPPHGTAHGSVTFQILEPERVKEIAEHGNLDIGNFHVGDDGREPEAVYDPPELGVIRTYRESAG